MTLPRTLELRLAHRPFGPKEVLIYYDGPVLMWLDTADGVFLAVALPADAGKWPFLLVKLDTYARRNLEAGVLTLRNAYTAADAVWHLPDYDADVLVAHRLEAIPEHWLPGDVGLN